MRGLLIYMLGTKAAPASAMYGSLASFAVQTDVLKAAAKTQLCDQNGKPDERYFVLEAILAIARKGPHKGRNKLMHWIYGESPNIPDKILLVEPDAFAEFQVAWDSHITKSVASQSLTPIPEIDKSRIWVYAETDYNELVRMIRDASSLIFGLNRVASLGSLRSLNEAKNDPQYCQLLAEPRVQKHVSDQHAGQNSNP